MSAASPTHSQTPGSPTSKSPTHGASPTSRNNATSPSKFEANTSLDDSGSGSEDDDDSALEALAAPLDLTFEEKLALAVQGLKPKKTTATVNKKWIATGKIKRITVKKRVMSVKERSQLAKESLQRTSTDNATGSSADAPATATDLEMPEEKLAKARKKLMNLASLQVSARARRAYTEVIWSH